MNHAHSNGGMGSRPWRHMLLMLICCLVPIGLVVAVGTFGLSLGPLQPLVPYIAALTCPLMMGIMMFMMLRGQGSEHDQHVHREHDVKQIPGAAVETTAAAGQDGCH